MDGSPFTPKLYHSTAYRGASWEIERQEENEEHGF